VHNSVVRPSVLLKAAKAKLSHERQVNGKEFQTAGPEIENGLEEKASLRTGPALHFQFNGRSKCSRWLVADHEFGQVCRCGRMFQFVDNIVATL
jgi:hypothetical protein